MLSIFLTFPQEPRSAESQEMHRRSWRCSGNGKVPSWEFFRTALNKTVRRHHPGLRLHAKADEERFAG